MSHLAETAKWGPEGACVLRSRAGPGSRFLVVTSCNPTCVSPTTSLPFPGTDQGCPVWPVLSGPELEVQFSPEPASTRPLCNLGQTCLLPGRQDPHHGKEQLGLCPLSLRSRRAMLLCHPRFSVVTLESEAAEMQPSTRFHSMLLPPLPSSGGVMRGPRGRSELLGTSRAP